MTNPKTPATPQAVPTTATKPKLRRRARTPKRPKALTLGGMIPRRKPKSLFTGAAGPPGAASGPAASPAPASPPPAGSVPIPGPLIAQMTQMSLQITLKPKTVNHKRKSLQSVLDGAMRPCKQILLTSQTAIWARCELVLRARLTANRLATQGAANRLVRRFKLWKSGGVLTRPTHAILDLLRLNLRP